MVKMRALAVGIGMALVVAAACSPNKGDDDDDDGGSGNVGGNTAGTGASGAVGGEGATTGEGGSLEAAGGMGEDGGAAPELGEGGSLAGGGSPGGTGGTGAVGGSTVEPDDGYGTTGPLTILVAAAQSPAIPGQPMLWTITVGNTSNTAVEGVEVLMRVPQGMAFSYSLANPSASYCGNGTCTANEEALWELGDLPAGALQTIQLAPSILDDVGDGDELAAQVRLSATDVDAISLTKTVPVAASVPVEVSVGASADPVVPGDIVELAVDIGHLGASSLFEGELTLELPGALEVVDISDGGLASAENSISWEVTSLPVGASLRRLVKAQLRSDLDNPGGRLMNPRATFTYEDAEVASVGQTPVGILEQSSALAVRVAPAADPVVPGASTFYDVTVSNTSARAVDGVELLLHLPPELSYAYTISAEPNSSYCSNGTCSSQELAAWDLGTIAAHTSQTVTIDPTALAAAAGDGTLVSTPFLVRALGETTLRAFKTIAAHAEPAAQLTVGTPVGPLAPAQSYTYHVDVGQIGPGSLQQTSLVLELPPGVVVDSISDAGQESDGRVTWDLGAVAVGAFAQRSVEVTIPEDLASGSLLGARAVLGYDGGQERDAISEHTLAVVSQALPLSVTVTASPDPVVLGGTVTYQTTIKNNAERSIDGVELLLRVPAGHSFSYTSGADPDSSYCSNGTCSGGEEAVWELGSIAAGATKLVTISPTAATALVGGSLATFRQRVTAVDLGGTISVQTTLPTVAD
jgi:hypothetical protein